MPRQENGVSSIGSTSGWDQMQAWSARRASAYNTYQTQTATLTASLSGSSDSVSTLGSLLSGGSSSAPSTFMSNDVLSSSLFDYTANILSAEETLIAQKVYTRVMAEHAKSTEGQDDQLAALQEQLASLSTSA